MQADYPGLDRFKTEGVRATHLVPRGPGADFAAAAIELGREWKSAPLGPGVELVIGPEPEPGTTELLAFARASGIPADAVDQLFGTAASAAARSPRWEWPTGATGLPTAPTPTEKARPGVRSAVDGGLAAWMMDATQRTAEAPAPVESLTRSFAEPSAQAVVSTQTAATSVSTPSASAGGVSTPALVPGAAPPPPNYAEMAQRVAQAVASRMVAGWREGSSRLRLELEPGNLGRVEIEMGLQDGRLEATLSAHQAVTRDLLSDGLARLRETLGQSGMNVALIVVSDGTNARGDGKPTRQRSGDSAYSRQASTTGAVDIAQDGPRPRRDAGNLDVWA
jgi:hypothetical protein